MMADRPDDLCRPGMVVALPAEARALLGKGRWLQHGDLAVREAPGFPAGQALWVRCGIGPRRAEKAASFLIEKGVTHLGIAGVSGGLSTDLDSGQLVVATEVVDTDGRSWPVSEELTALLSTRLGELGRPGATLTSGEPLLSVGQKAHWQRRSRALAVDMESAAVARVAASAGRPFFVLRAICDDACRSVPAALFDLVDDSGRPRVVKLLTTLTRQPSLLAPLLRMQGDFSRALTALRHGWQICRRSHPMPMD